LLRVFLILTGASAAGITVGVILHNVVYGLCISLFSVDFWERIGLVDEPVFFVFALIVCPVALLVGSIKYSSVYSLKPAINSSLINRVSIDTNYS
jgi:hypothetical protein